MNNRFYCVFVAFLAATTLPACNFTIEPVPTYSPPDSYNWESPHVSPLALTPDRKTLLAVNTMDNRLLLFDVTGDAPTQVGDVPVGLDPVSVRARTNTEAWVVNRISDSVSVVDLPSRRVIATLNAGDEPADVVFAGNPQRAFVSVARENKLKVYNPSDLAAEPVVIDIEGESPRALAVDSTGNTVYLAIFESGNGTTIIRHEHVSDGGGPYLGVNPPPNRGDVFDPQFNPELPTPPKVAQIVRKRDGGWLDSNERDWSNFVTWDLADHDIAVIDAQSLGVSYISGLMNLNMALDVSPSGQVTVVGSDAINDVRFEPNVAGIFDKMLVATIDPGRRSSGGIFDLNPHLDYSARQIPADQRRQSVSDPRAIIWSRSSNRAYVSGMGTDNVIAINSQGRRLGRIDVPPGPTGLALDDARGRLYVLSKFAGSVSVINTRSETLANTVPFYDPTPPAIRNGRPHLYNATKSSGLGQLACASCHVDARMDQLAWDLGNPAGQTKTLDQPCRILFDGGCSDWHPMKGPLVTQTLVGIIGTEPLHWRGDRESIRAFNGAFESLMANDHQLTDEEMNQFEAFLKTIVAPPNPHRNFDGSLKSEMTLRNLPADAAHGFDLYQNGPNDGQIFTCVNCHSLPTGAAAGLISAKKLAVPQDFKIAQLRNLYEKSGFDRASKKNLRGFGLTHDGAFENVVTFLHHVVFNVPTEQDKLDLEAFVLSFSMDTHPAVGVQVTLGGPVSNPDAAKIRVGEMRDLADKNTVGLIAKGFQNGAARGYTYLAGQKRFQSDRIAESIPFDDLVASAAAGGEITFTVVPSGSQFRLGIDRDLDGVLDGDEIDAGTDPANADSY